MEKKIVQLENDLSVEYWREDGKLFFEVYHDSAQDIMADVPVAAPDPCYAKLTFLETGP